MIHTLNDYIALLEARNLLAAPIPGGLYRSAPVEKEPGTTSRES